MKRIFLVILGGISLFAFTSIYANEVKSCPAIEEVVKNGEWVAPVGWEVVQSKSKPTDKALFFDAVIFNYKARCDKDYESYISCAYLDNAVPPRRIDFEIKRTAHPKTCISQISGWSETTNYWLSCVSAFHPEDCKWSFDGN